MMNAQEKQDLLVQNLLDVFSRCRTFASPYPKPKRSLLSKLTGGDDTEYPDICINNYQGRTGEKAYYYVRLMGVTPKIDERALPEDIRSGWVKLIQGSVFCLEKQQPDLYIKGCHYVAQYSSTALFPAQDNPRLQEIKSDFDLANMYVAAWRNLDADIIAPVLDKNFHYASDAVFDDMASRDEYLTYLRVKFDRIRENNTLKRIELGRNGENGGWAALIKQVQNDGSSIVCGFFITSHNGRITGVRVREMDMPDF